MIILITILILIGLGWLLSNKWHIIAPYAFDIEREMDHVRVKVGEPVRLTTTMTNKKWMPLPWVNVFSNIAPSFSFQGESRSKLTPDHLAEYNMVTSFLFYERVKRHDIFIPEKRGYYKLENMVVSFGDLFGFSKAERTYTTEKTIVVHPKAKPVSKYNFLPIHHMGPISVKRWISPDPIQAVGARAYTHDDPFNTIDWKSTAKMGHLQVKKMDFTSEPSLMVYFDVQSNPKHWNEIDKEAVENGVDLCASILEEATKIHALIGFSVNSVDPFSRNATFIDPSSSHAQKSKILDALAMVSPFRGIPMTELIRKTHGKLQRGSVIITVTACLTESLWDEMKRLSVKGYRVKVITLKKPEGGVNIRKQSGIEVIEVAS